jgi:hypothetical protein
MENTTSIEVLAKTTEENLRVKNTEFLEKYPTEESQITYYTNLATKVTNMNIKSTGSDNHPFAPYGIVNLLTSKYARL